MPAQRLSIFDIIVDLLPGILFIILLTPLAVFTKNIIPQFGGIQGVSSLYEGIFNSAIILLTVGYISGRALHALAARDGVKELLFNNAYGFAASGRSGDIFDHCSTGSVDEFNFPSRAESIASEYSNSDDIQWDSLDPNKADSLEHRVIMEILESVRSRMDPSGSLNLSSNGTFPSGLDWESDLEFIEHYGHSLLYGENSLYHRYTILATFYRSLYFSLISSSVFYILMLAPTLILKYYFTTALFFAVFVVLLAISRLFAARWIEFRYRRLRALINELHNELR